MQLGDYVVEKAVAWGGMGIVYRAVHPLIGRKVAVKVLRPTFASDPEQMARFLKEAQAVASIKHRGIIDIIGFGKLPAPDGRQYMVMEFLDGESLEAVMAREAPMSAARVIAIADELFDALSAAHKVGVIHRDLKPANVFITEPTHGARYVKLVDFGLARVAPVAELNRTGRASMMAGTPEYVSPEQARGVAATPPTDLYCAGVMLFEMLTGRLPFEGLGLLDLLNAHVNETPPRVSTLVQGVPPELDDLIAELLLKDPTERPSSADVARQRVQRLARQLKEASTTIMSRPTALAEPPPVEKTQVIRLAAPTTDKALELALATGRPSARPAWLVPTLGFCAVLVVAIGVASLKRSRPEAPTAPVPTAPVPTTPPAVPTTPEPMTVVVPPTPTPLVAPAPPSEELTALPPIKSATRPNVVAKPVVVKPPAEKTVVTVSVTLKGQRSWADIDVNGVRQADQAPTQFRLAAGTYKLRVSQPGITPVERKVTIGSGNQMVLIELTP